MSSSKGKGKARQAQQARRPAASPAGGPARAGNLNRGKNGNSGSLNAAIASREIGKNGNAPSPDSAATRRVNGKNGNGGSSGAALSGKNGNTTASLRNRRTPVTSRPAASGTRQPDNTDAVQLAPASESLVSSFTARASATSPRRDTTDSHAAPTLFTAEREPAGSTELAPRPARGRTAAAIAELPAPTMEDLPEPPVERSPLPRRPLRERVEAAGTAFSGRLRAVTREQWLWFGILALAAVLRFWGLGDKPLHHDESMHAYFSLQFAENPGGYAYNPLLHGPFQFHAEGLVFALILGLQAIFVHGAAGNPWINDTTARILPALFGLGIVALPLGLRRELGRIGAPTAAFLLAVSPSFVYFSRFLREDIYFCFFMFAMVVCAVRFAHSHATKWFVGLFAATVLAYATFEGTFLTLAIFVGFLAVVLVWDLGHGLAGLLPGSFSSRERVLLTRAGLLCLLGAVAAVVAKIALQKLNEFSTYLNDPKHPEHVTATDAQVRLLEDRSVAVLLYLSIAVALLVIGTLLWQMYRDDLIYGRPEAYDAFADDEEYVAALQTRYRASRAARVDRIFSAPSRGIARLRARLDPERQSFLRLLLSVTWVQWFVAFVVAWMLFAALFWIIPPGPADNPAPTIGAGFQRGVGLGLWQGLYYWIQQQQVARGGQPWYYYLLVIPLYEQLVVVFGLGGAVYSFFRPNRFRLFLVWWFAASLFLYSWAGEKMPWLTIQILLPLFLLAAVALARLFEAAYAVIERFARQPLTFGRPLQVLGQPAILGVLLAVLLLIPMIHNMLTLSQVDAAVAPREMLVYVQTTPDWTRVMNKIQALDQRLYGGRHQISIGVGVGMEWPTYWYLRDYPNAHFGYDPTVAGAVPVDVMLLAQWESDGQQYLSETPAGWSAHQYKLRWWWDEGYKPRPCVATKTNNCQQSDFLLYGIGLGPYLSYGQPAAKGQPDFTLGKAIGRIWSWEWTRTPIGSLDPGSTDFAFVVRAGLPIQAYP